MTAEEKTSLLNDLCGRLLTTTFVEITDNQGNTTIVPLTFQHILDFKQSLISIKPYYRPISSMTDAEKKHLHRLLDLSADDIVTDIKTDNCGIDNGKYHFYYTYEIDWLNEQHFDYRYLIDKGLALEAPEQMYYDEQ